MTPLRTVLLPLILITAIVLAVGLIVVTIFYSPPIHPPSPASVITRNPSPENPPPGYWIKMDPISDKTSGEIFNISTTTNLSVDEKILIQVYYANHTSLDQRKFSGLSDYTNVIAGRDGINRTVFTVNTSDYYPAWYIATESAVIANASPGYTYFRVFSEQNATEFKDVVITQV